MFRTEIREVDSIAQLDVIPSTRRFLGRTASIPALAVSLPQLLLRWRTRPLPILLAQHCWRCANFAVAMVQAVCLLNGIRLHRTFAFSTLDAPQHATRRYR